MGLREERKSHQKIIIIKKIKHLVLPHSSKEKGISWC
jgi:hypothetical protein